MEAVIHTNNALMSTYTISYTQIGTHADKFKSVEVREQMFLLNISFDLIVCRNTTHHVCKICVGVNIYDLIHTDWNARRSIGRGGAITIGFDAIFHPI